MKIYLAEDKTGQYLIPAANLNIATEVALQYYFNSPGTVIEVSNEKGWVLGKLKHEAV